MALSPLNLKQQAPRYQNEFSGSSGGTSVQKQTLARASSNKSAARINASTTLSGNVLFKGANRGFSQIRYMSGRNAAIGLNYHRASGQQFGFSVDSRPSPTVANQQTVVQSPKPSWGQQIAEVFTAGAAAFVAISGAIQQAKDAGLISSKTKPQGANSNTNSNQLDNAFKDFGGSGGGGIELSATGLQTASSFGVGFDAQYNTISNALKSDTLDPQSITSSVSSLVMSSTNDLYSAMSLQSVLSKQEAKTVDQETQLQTDLTKAKDDADTAKSDLGRVESQLKGAKDTRANADSALQVKDAEYKSVCDNVIKAETDKSKAQDDVTSCNNNVGTATSKLDQATSQYDTAKSNYDNIPNDAEHQLEKAAAKRIMDSAEQAKTQAQEALESAKKDLAEAEGKLKDAESELSKAQVAKQKKLEEYKNAESDLKQLAENCEKQQKLVETQSKNYDAARQRSDICDKTYAQLQADMSGINSIHAQKAQIEAKISTLETNVRNADKLQKSVDKAVQKWNKKHPGGTTTTTNTDKPDSGIVTDTGIKDTSSTSSDTQQAGLSSDIQNSIDNGSITDATLKNASLDQLHEMKKFAEMRGSYATGRIYNAIEQKQQYQEWLANLDTNLNTTDIGKLTDMIAVANSNGDSGTADKIQAKIDELSDKGIH